MELFILGVVAAFFLLGFIAKQLTIANYKSYDRKVRAAARRHGGKDYLTENSTTPEKFASYRAEVDSIAERHGYKKAK